MTLMTDTVATAKAHSEAESAHGPFEEVGRWFVPSLRVQKHLSGFVQP